MKFLTCPQQSPEVVCFVGGSRELCSHLPLYSDEWVDRLFGGGMRWLVMWGQVLMSLLLSFSERIHGDQEEVQVPLLQLLSHAPVHP